MNENQKISKRATELLGFLARRGGRATRKDFILGRCYQTGSKEIINLGLAETWYKGPAPYQNGMFLTERGKELYREMKLKGKIK